MKIIKVSTELEMSVHEFPEGTMREQNKALYDLIGNGCDIVEHVMPKRLYTELKMPSTKKKKTYRIVQGDTLCGISRKKYKTESKWRNIYNANKKVIEAAAKKHGRRNSDNGHWIYPGTVLTLP